MTFKDALASFTQRTQRDAKTFIRFLRSRFGLKQQVQRRSAFHGFKLRRDVCQAAGLRGNLVDVNQPIERVKNRAYAFYRFSRGVYPNYGIATAVEQAVKCRKQDSGCVIRWMIGLQSNAQ